MTFVKTEWINESAPDITAEQLNRIEQGIFDAHAGFVAANTLASEATLDAESAVDIVNAHLADPDAHPGVIGSGGSIPWINLRERGALGDDTFHNSSIFQEALDEIGAAGGGTFFIPYGNGNSFKTRSLYVWSNTRILIDRGVTLRNVGPSLGYRNVYNDSEPAQPHPPRYARALFTLGPMKLLGNYSPSNNVEINGGKITVDDGHLGQLGISVEGDDVTISNLSVEGNPFDALTLNHGQRITVRNCRFKEGRRNCVSLVGNLSWVYFEDCVFSHCQASVGNPEGSPSEQMPGCGIELEPDNVGYTQRHIFITRCTAHNNGGAGIGMDLSHNGGLRDCGDIFVTDCVSYANGQSANALFFGGVHLRGENETGYPRINIQLKGNVLRDNLRAAGLQFVTSGTCRLDVQSLGTYFRGNANGAVGNSGNNIGMYDSAATVSV